MKTTLISVLLLVPFFSSASNTNNVMMNDSSVMLRLANAHSDFPLVLGGQSNKTEVLVMETLQSQAVRELFPKLTVYRLISSRSVVHFAECGALLIDTNGSPTHLKTDDEVAYVVGGLSRNVRTKEDALRLVQAFADLRSYRVLLSPPKYPDARERSKVPPPLETDYKFVTEERKNEWRVYATFDTSAYGGCYRRYVFTIWKEPAGGLEVSDCVTIHVTGHIF